MNGWRSHLRALAICICSALLPASVRAQNVSIMVGGIEKQIYLPAILAERLGYFRDEGLDVTLLSEPAGVEAADEMLAGAVQAVVGFYDHNIDLQALGKYTESVVQFSRAPGEVELVSTRHTEITSIAGFKGRTIGVTGLGSSTDFLTEYLLVKSGLALSDVVTLPVGASDSLIAAIRHDQIQAAMTTEPTISRLLKSGEARVLVDMRTLEGTKEALGGTYPAACLYMENSWVEAHRQTVQKLANAFVKTMHFIASHTADEIAAEVPADYYAGDRKLYVEALAAGKQMFTADGRMPEDGPSTVLKVLRTIKPRLQNTPIALSRTFTTEFVDKANGGG